MQFRCIRFHPRPSLSRRYGLQYTLVPGQRVAPCMHPPRQRTVPGDQSTVTLLPSRYHTSFRGGRQADCLERVTSDRFVHHPMPRYDRIVLRTERCIAAPERLRVQRAQTTTHNATDSNLSAWNMHHQHHVVTTAWVRIGAGVRGSVAATTYG
jgi:hypothetical protein